jgi:methylglutaconyl-CoA hydratase
VAYEHILVAAGPAASVSLNRPKVKNAMSDQTLKELAHAIHDLAMKPEVRVVVVRGEGPDFCAGADIEWMRRAGKLSPEEGRKDARLLADMLSAVDEHPVPVIVAAQGSVFGGGLGLLAACDIAIAAEDARFSFSECRLGIMPAVISCWVLPRIGAANARRYYLTAEVFGAQAAVHMGLIQEEVPGSGLADRAAALAESVVRNGPNAVKAAKALIPRFQGLPRAKQIDLAVDTLVSLRSSAEGQEGLSAFLEKRPPSWAKGGR